MAWATRAGEWTILLTTTQHWWDEINTARNEMCKLLCPSAIITWTQLWHGVRRVVSTMAIMMTSAWWRHQMETFSALLALCAVNTPVTGELPSQRPVSRSFDVFFDLQLNKRLSKLSWGWWFETSSPLLWRHCNGTEPIFSLIVKHVEWDRWHWNGTLFWRNFRHRVHLSYGQVSAQPVKWKFRQNNISILVLKSYQKRSECHHLRDIFMKSCLFSLSWTTTGVLTHPHPHPHQFGILIKISQKCVPNGPINNNLALVQIMAWHRIGDKPLFESMLTWFTGAYMRNYGRWVN